MATKKLNKSGSITFLSNLFGLGGSSKHVESESASTLASEVDRGSLPTAGVQVPPSPTVDESGLHRKMSLPPVDTMPQDPVPIQRPSTQSRAGAFQSLAEGMFDRYWRLGDVLNDPDVKLSWPLRFQVALDVAGEIKQAHDHECALGSVEVRSIVLTDKILGRIQDTEQIKRTSSAEPPMPRDILGFGLILIQLICGKNLFFLEEDESKRDPTYKESLSQLYTLFNKEVACSKGAKENDDISDLANDFDFTAALDSSIRNTLQQAFANAPEIPKNIAQNVEELIVQCCSSFRENRPTAETIMEWFGSIVDDLHKALNFERNSVQDLTNRDEVLSALQPKDIEIMGEVNISRENKFVTGKITVNEDGYETDDSYMPPSSGAKKEKLKDIDDDDDAPAPAPVAMKERRKSRLSMFTEEVQASIPEPTPPPSPPQEDQLAPLPSRRKSKPAGGGADWATKKQPNKRASIKPTQASRFSMLWGSSAPKESSASSLAKNVITPENLKKKFDAQERLSNDELVALLVAADATLRKDPNMPVVQAPAVTVGDLHGQYYDLQNLLSLGGSPKDTKYIFLGDYVDRGDWSCEVLFFILCLKVHYPQNVTTLRGNHECDAVASYFGFKEECEQKYGRAIFNRSIACFQCMPVAALIETGGAGRFLCCHGGISPHISSLEQIEKCDRFVEPGMNGFLCDILWSDPVNDTFDDGQHESLAELLSIDFISNPARGCSFRYGYRAIISFLASNQLAAIIRAHEVQQDGYKYHFQDITGKAGGAKARIMPPVITVFSAPNYCGRYGNKGAILRVNQVPQGNTAFKPIDLLEPLQFDAIEHPEPRVLENETVKQTMRIEKQLPYMPTTFSTFLARASELVHEDDNQDESDTSVLERIPAMERPRRESAVEAANKLRMQNDKTKEPLEFVDLGNIFASMGVTETKKTTNMYAKETEELAKASKVKSLVARYQQAAAVDGINEMHPVLVQKKFADARARLEKDKRNSIKGLLDKSGGAVVTIHKDENASQSDKVSISTASANGTEITEDEEVNFSNDEVLSLKLLFLMIDRADDGSIDADDLVSWSAEEGVAVQKSEADLCIAALDEDKDGKIGFVDYLNFAATLKLRWKKQNESTSVLNTLVKKPAKA